MRLNAGKLNKRIQIVSVEKQKDADGYWTESDKPVHSCWAQFSRTSGKEIRQNDADYAEISVRFLIRYTRTELSRKMVVLYRGDRYEIEYINNYGDSNDYIELIAKQLTLEG